TDVIRPYHSISREKETPNGATNPTSRYINWSALLTFRHTSIFHFLFSIESYAQIGIWYCHHITQLNQSHLGILDQ
ncbi:MAG: hypothetical protein MK081_14685, partial [Flavobacteriales bacterium]|nr:hypothetical protein [Flavobacteriales bacterium]